MWGIQRRDYTYPYKFSSLVCAKPANQESAVLTLAIRYYPGERIEFSITVLAKKASFLSDQFTKITSSTSNRKVWDNNVINFQLKVAADFYQFNKVMDILRNEIDNFIETETAIIKLVNAPKRLALTTTGLHQKDATKKVEDDVDNNQRSSVFISALQSEARLRITHNFPNPNYPNDLEDDIDFDPNDPEAAAIAAAVKADATEQYDYAHHDISKYSPEENELIASLLETLEETQEKLIQKGLLVYKIKEDDEEEPYLVLSEEARRLISNPTAEDSQKKIDRAKLALDVMTCIRALKPGGSHSHNGAMEQTKIVGYGMRNIIALLYKCYKETFEYDPDAEEQEHIFMTGVSNSSAFLALLRGIARGARGNNRNDDDGEEDDLGEIDLRVCDRGRYNASIEAFNGILKNVEIIYEITDLMLIEFKKEIIATLLQRPEVRTLAIDKDYLDIWLGKNPNKRFMRYQAFENQIKANFPGMLKRFLNKVCGHSKDLKYSLDKELKLEIKAVEEHSLGLGYIETVSPSSELLEAQWNLLHPRNDKRAKFSLTACG